MQRLRQILVCDRLKRAETVFSICIFDTRIMSPKHQNCGTVDQEVDCLHCCISLLSARSTFRLS